MYISELLRSTPDSTGMNILSQFAFTTMKKIDFWKINPKYFQANYNKQQYSPY